MMRKSLRRFLLPPVFIDDDEKTRRVNILHYASILIFFFSVFIFLTNLMMGSSDQEAIDWVLGIVVLTQVAVQILIRFGRAMVAGHILMIFGWSAVTIMAHSVDGIRDIAIFGYVAIILGAGYLLGWKTAVLFTSISIAAIWWLADLQAKGLVVPSLVTSPYQTALDLSAIFVVILLIAYFIFRSLTRALENAHRELSERHRIEAELENAIVRLSDEIAERKQVQVELQEQAITDFLTGLFNRRYFFEIAEKEFAKAVRYDRPMSVIIFDLDFFKNVNDTYGHDTGDQALIQIGEMLRSKIRDVDISARYGGEEFIVLLPEMNCENTEIVAERLRKTVENTPIQAEGNLVNLTISVGVAGKGCTLEINSVDQLISKADQALYQAKRAGRNQVICYRDIHSTE